ncbi:hypothetical protein SETIT_7G066900v2 [Setaria italica]|uniref:Zinc knuckle CX2CX4HX4C domain-containing protein n=1 Tax=Setaria italica TaxID=4555 RepID=A0A368RT30_SETIT|nr:hypothetical protein SETIT_7G066900v2 [Setaria italica]
MDKSPVKAEVGKKFILEFLVEGDWKHIIMGGPWQYKGDAFLVEGITSGIDPSAALFTDVLMWKLAHDLGESLGTTMMIDSSARGPINNKFLRTRVQLPLFTALQKEIVLVDDITGEEFVVQVRYERLPNFCLFCGYIRHVEDICDLPAGERKINFSLDLHVHPVHFDDPRCWNLPDCLPVAIAQAPTIGNKKVVDLVEKVAQLTIADNQQPKNIDRLEDGTGAKTGVDAEEENGAMLVGVRGADAIGAVEKDDGKHISGNKQGKETVKAINSLNSLSTAGSTCEIKVKG